MLAVAILCACVFLAFLCGLARHRQARRADQVYGRRWTPPRR
jgi:hypothetical protein